MSDDDDANAWRARYEQRIRSAQWKNMKRDLIRLRGDRCEHCGSGAMKLELHHKSYERLGKELLSDIELLCHACHCVADEKRAAAGRQRSVEALYNAGLDTYATKKYGDDWDMDRPYEDVAEEFDRWLERHDDD